MPCSGITQLPLPRHLLLTKPSPWITKHNEARAAQKPHDYDVVRPPDIVEKHYILLLLFLHFFLYFYTPAVTELAERPPRNVCHMLGAELMFKKFTQMFDRSLLRVLQCG